MKVRKEEVDFVELTVERVFNDDAWAIGCEGFRYMFTTREFIDINDLIIKKKVSTPETLEEYKELNCLSDKNILDILMKK